VTDTLPLVSDEPGQALTGCGRTWTSVARGDLIVTPDSRRWHLMVIVRGAPTRFVAEEEGGLETFIEDVRMLEWQADGAGWKLVDRRLDPARRSAQP
jgi:hypothetical protein